ncbi:hypothetical protein [Spirosoma litoris]
MKNKMANKAKRTKRPTKQVKNVAPVKKTPQIPQEIINSYWSRVWGKAKRWSAKVYTLIVAIIGITGYTVVNFLPDVSIELKNPSDKITLIFEVTNKSWVAIKNINTLLIVDTLQTTRVENIGKVMGGNAQAVYKKLSHNQTYTFDYEPGTFYGPDPNYNLFSARIALAVKYSFLGIEMEDYAFYDGMHDANGSFLWRKMPERKFAKEIETDTTRLDTNSIPFYKNFERNTRGIPRGPMPPMPKIDSGDN